MRASNNKNGAYQLELEPQKKNVFVTQLNDRDDNEGEFVKKLKRCCSKSVLLKKWELLEVIEVPQSFSTILPIRENKI